MTKTEPWSITIKRRRLKWAGHLLRLDPLTPARRSLAEALIPGKRKPGRPPLTWTKLISKDIQDTGIIKTDPNETLPSIFNKLETLAQNRRAFGTKVNCCIPQKRCLPTRM